MKAAALRLTEAVSKAEKEIVSALLKSREGRLFFAMLIEASGFLKNGFHDTPEHTAFAQGERSVGGMVFNLILSCDESGIEPLKCMNEYREWYKQISIQELTKTQNEESGEEA